MFAKVSKKDPLLNYNFRVTIVAPKLGNIQCGFQSVSGLGVTVNFKEYREGGNNYIPDKLVEYVSDNPVVFTAGVTDNDAILDLSNFYLKDRAGVVGAFENRFDVIVEVMDKQNKNAGRKYKLEECVLETFLIGDLNSMGAETFVESFSVRFNALKS